LAALMFLAALTVGAVTVLLVSGHDGGVTTITGITGVLLAQLLIGYQTAQTGAQLDEVAKNVNGNMTTLVNAKTQPDAPAIVAPSVDDMLRALVTHLASVAAVPGVVPVVQPPGVQSPPGTAQGA
jgi:hypothetical protein